MKTLHRECDLQRILIKTQEKFRKNLRKYIRWLRKKQNMHAFTISIFISVYFLYGVMLNINLHAWEI